MCFLLGLGVRFFRWLFPRERGSVSGHGTLVVFKFFGLGSITEATPMLRALRRRYPDARLAFVTFEENAALVRRFDLCTDVRIIRTGSAWRFASDTVRQLYWLWRNRVEASIDLEFFSKFSTLMSFLSGAPIRVGFHLNDFWRYSLVTHPIYFNYYRCLPHVYEQAAEQLGAKIEDHSLEPLVVERAALASVRAHLKEHGWSPDIRLLGVNINAGELSYERRWPMVRFAKAVRELLQRHGSLMIVLTGAPSEQEYVASLFDRLPDDVRPRAVVAAGRWSLEEFIAGLSLFQGFVTNDSGPLHLAAAAGVPIVSIWGPSHPDFYAPRVKTLRKVYADYPCSPCVGMFTTFEGMWCNHEAWCMQAIEVSTVVSAVEDLLARTAESRQTESTVPADDSGPKEDAQDDFAT